MLPSYSQTSPRACLNRREAALYLSISTRLLDDLLSAGEIQKVKIGRKTVVPIRSLDSYIESKVQRLVVEK